MSPVARPLAEWTESVGDALWWEFPVSEAAWIGTPQCKDWPGYHTHWTPHPEAPVHPADVKPPCRRHTTPRLCHCGGPNSVADVRMTEIGALYRRRACESCKAITFTLEVICPKMDTKHTKVSWR